MEHPAHTASAAKSQWQLVGWHPLDRSPLIGRCDVQMPPGLVISGVGLFVRGADRWAALPAEAVRDHSGQLIRDPATNKVQYRSSLRWADRTLQARFSARVFELVEAEVGPLGGGGR